MRICNGLGTGAGAGEGEGGEGGEGEEEVFVDSFAAQPWEDEGGEDVFVDAPEGPAAGAPGVLGAGITGIVRWAARKVKLVG